MNDIDNNKDHAGESLTDKEQKEKTEKSDSEKPQDQPTEQDQSSSAEENQLGDTDKEEANQDDKSDAASETDQDNTIPEKQEDKEEQKINYGLLSRDDLVKVFQDLINNKSIEELKNTVPEIEEIYNQKAELELQEKKKHFLESGGLEQDFKPVEDPVTKTMSELLDKYRSLRSEYNKQIEGEKEKNLEEKHEILEQFRLLMEGQENFDNTFRKFKQLQKSWFDIGIVPKQNIKDLWNSYNFFVDKFNDYVSINKELRFLDYKKNLEAKIKLCENAEQLEQEKNVVDAFKRLQKYHAQWREIGPVPREDKDTVWERFKAATSKINKAHQEFQSQIKDSLVQNLELKSGLCDKVEALAGENNTTHQQWVEKTDELLAIQKEWKTIGYAPKKDNNQIYSRFRKACDQFFENKAAFYAKNFEKQKESLEEKNEIVEKAEALKDSTDWKTTTDQLIALQKKWKNTGPVPRKESDILWKRFRAACDHFFSNKSNFYGGKDESYEENLKEKQELIKEISDIKAPENKNEIIQMLEDFQDRYNEIGFVPIGVKDKVRDEFKKALEVFIDRSDFDESERQLARYRLKIKGMESSPRSENKIYFEREKLFNKLQQLTNDIGVWENNIGFFKQTESSEETLAGFQEKIDNAKQRIYLLEKKIEIIDDMDKS